MVWLILIQKWLYTSEYIPILLIKTNCSSSLLITTDDCLRLLITVKTTTLTASLIVPRPVWCLSLVALSL